VQGRRRLHLTERTCAAGPGIVVVRVLDSASVGLSYLQLLHVLLHVLLPINMTLIPRMPSNFALTCTCAVLLQASAACPTVAWRGPWVWCGAG
jgi:hypothetical protein